MIDLLIGVVRAELRGESLPAGEIDDGAGRALLVLSGQHGVTDLLLPFLESRASASIQAECEALLRQRRMRAMQLLAAVGVATTALADAGITTNQHH